MLDTRHQLERALNETQGPLRVTSECLYHREGRKGIDLVHDAPEGSFMAEVDTIKAAQDRMRRQLQQERRTKLHFRLRRKSPVKLTFAEEHWKTLSTRSSNYDTHSEPTTYSMVKPSTYE